jgi:hypothetical protein
VGAVAQFGANLDLVAGDATGKPLKQDTIRRALNRDLEGRVDAIGDDTGGRRDRRWWRLP